MKALVLGGNGFLGSHLVDHLLAEGHEVVVIDRAPGSDELCRTGVTQLQGAFDNDRLVSKALRNCDVVYHLVSTTVPSTSNVNPVADIQGNLIATVRFLDIMIKSGVRKIVYFSSGGTVYGEPGVDFVDESSPLSPMCSYGVVKVAIENYLRMYAHLYGLQPTVLRASNPYGPRQGNSGLQGLVGSCLRKVHQGLPVEVWGDGSIVRDYIFVGDLVRLAVLAGKSGTTGIFNAGTGVGHTVTDVVRAVGRAIGREPAIIYKPGRAYDVRRIVLDVEKAKKAFAWEPVVDLAHGLAMTWLAVKEGPQARANV